MRRALAGTGMAVALATSGLTWSQERGLQKVQGEGETALSLTLRVQVKDGAGLRTVADGESLHTGDLVQFVVAVDQPAYVYIVQYFTDASAAVLHPEGGDALLRPGYEARVPEPGSWFKLVPPPGSEAVYFIATKKALGEADLRIAEAIRIIRDQGAISRPPGVAPSVGSNALLSRPVPAAPPPPSAFGLGTRGRLVKVPAGATPGVTIQSGPDGVAIYAFTIRHQPRP